MTPHRIAYQRLQRSLLSFPSTFPLLFKCQSRRAIQFSERISFQVTGPRLSSHASRSAPRAFPQTGYEVVEANRLMEEEEMIEYRPEHFYPVHLGEVFNHRYQTVAKLGQHQYAALKIYIHNSVQHRELPFYKHLDQTFPTQHPGGHKIRRLLNSFEVSGPHGRHVALVLQAAQMSLRDMDVVFMKGKGFEEDFVKGAIQEVLGALDFLHTEVQSIHTDVHPGNLLLGIDDDSFFKKLEDSEFSNPVPRKPRDDRTIYFSRLMKPKAGPLLLSDFGEARLGPGPHAGDIMPIVYRAPETLLHIQWSYPVDIWSVGLTTWDLLQGRTLFSARKEDGSLSDGAHFAELIAALGPPPQSLLDRHRQRALEYWDEQGNWGGFVPIPTEKTLAAAETKLADNTEFLQFIRRALAWDPAARPTAKELLQDPWLNS